MTANTHLNARIFRDLNFLGQYKLISPVDIICSPIFFL